MIKKGVRVNAVAPGPFWTVLQPSGGQTQEKVQHFGQSAPMGRPGHEPDCKMQNMKADGSSVSADMVCDSKDMKGGGHFALVYDSPEHYTGKVTMSMDTHGRHMTTNTSFEAKWLSADCKAK